MIKDLYDKYIDCGYQISTDTRNIKDKSLFVALKGPNFNANLFANQALEKGAKYALIDDAKYAIKGKTILVDNALKTLQDLANHHRNQFSIPVIGITGSNGKTTSKELIGAVLKSEFNILVTQGNLNNHIGVPLTLLRLNKSHQIAIIEMGANHIGEIRELSSIVEPTHGVITNIGIAHIEGFGSKEGVLKTKKELYDHIANKNGILFCNQDDEKLTNILPKNTQNVLFGKNSPKISGQIKEANPFISFSWRFENYNSNELKTHLIGEYNFYNFLLAITIGTFFKVKPSNINNSLISYQPSNNRSQVVKTEHNTVIVDCYNANPTSVMAALNSFKLIDSENKLVILGDMLELGKISATEHLNVLNFLSNNNLNCITVGKEFKKVKSEFKNFDTVELLIKHIKNNQIKANFLLLKGSRAIKLETLINSKAI